MLAQDEVANLPIQLFTESPTQGGNYGFGGCQLTGIKLSGGRHLENIGRSARMVSWMDY